MRHVSHAIPNIVSQLQSLQVYSIVAIYKDPIVFNTTEPNHYKSEMVLNIPLVMSKSQIINLKQLGEKNEARLNRNEIKRQAWLTKVDGWRKHNMDHPKYHINHPEEQYFCRVKSKLDQKIERLKRDKERYSQMLQRHSIGANHGSRLIPSRLKKYIQKSPVDFGANCFLILEQVHYE